MGERKKAAPKTRQSTNAVIQMQVAAQRGEAAGRLLAAEAEYLTAHGWTPNVVVPSSPLDGGFERVLWVSPQGVTLRQSSAVEQVKREDPNLLGQFLGTSGPCFF